MITYSLVFSIRNRATELPVSLPSVLTKYSQDVVEIICMDDHSTDGSKQIAVDIFKRYGWTNYKLFDSTRESSGYDLSQAGQTNFLVNQAVGEYIILQSAEVAHIDHVIGPLHRHCHRGQPSFATVYDAPAKEGMMLTAIKEFLPPFFGSCVGVRPEAVIFDAATFRLAGDCAPQRIRFVNGSELLFAEYTGFSRAAPLFFCGMIMKEDWVSLGGYDPELPTDVKFFEKMGRNHYRYAFTSTIALHITHAKK